MGLSHVPYWIRSRRIPGTVHSSTPTTEELLKRAEDMMREDWEFLKDFNAACRPTSEKAGEVPD